MNVTIDLIQLIALCVGFFSLGASVMSLIVLKNM